MNIINPKLAYVTTLILVTMLIPASPIKASGSSRQYLISDPERIVTRPPTPRPAYRQTIQDPVFGTRLTRVVGDPGESFIDSRGTVGTWGRRARQVYSSIQAWNADQSLLLLLNLEGGSHNTVILDAETFEVKYAFDIHGRTPGRNRWHPRREHSDILISVFLDELRWFNVRTGEFVKTIKLPYERNEISGKGKPSADGRTIAIFGAPPTIDNNGKTVYRKRYAYIVDMDNEIIGPPFDSKDDCGLANCVIDDPLENNQSWNSLSISPTGEFLKFSYPNSPNTVTRFFKVDQETLRLTPHPQPPFPKGCEDNLRCPKDADPQKGYPPLMMWHSDWVLGQDGEDYHVGNAHFWNRRVAPEIDTIDGTVGGVVAIHAKSGEMKSLTPSLEVQRNHFSGRAFRRPGWVYYDHFTDQPNREIMNGEVVAVNIHTRQVERLVHHHGMVYPAYKPASHIWTSASPDGMHVLFSSSWGQENNTLEQAYVLDTRPLTNNEQDKKSDADPKTKIEIVNLIHPEVRSEAEINITVEEPTTIRLQIMSREGLIKELANSEFGRGLQSFSWDARTTSGLEVASGTYWAIIETGENKIIEEIIVVR